MFFLHIQLVYCFSATRSHRVCCMLVNIDGKFYVRMTQACLYVFLVYADFGKHTCVGVS